MKTPMQLEIERNLVSDRENIFKKLHTLFNDKAIEAHVFGSVARQQTDTYSDIDIWFTFKDNDFDEIYRKRFEYYKLIGDVLHLCEAHQNAPINGVHTTLLIRSQTEAISVVDIYLCPFSTSYRTEEVKKLFGIDVPLGIIGFNSKKVTVDKDYRIDFFICFIFGTIKKLARNNPNPLDGVLRQYEHLYETYKILTDQLDSTEQNFNTLETIIDNTQKVANERQKKTLEIIHDYGRSVLGFSLFKN